MDILQLIYMIIFQSISFIIFSEEVLKDLLYDCSRIRLEYQSLDENDDNKVNLENSFINNTFLMVSLLKDKSISNEIKGIIY